MDSVLKGKNLTIGITGSIAAFKSAELVSKIVQDGSIVQCLMSKGATNFVTPLTFQTLTGKRVLYETFDIGLVDDPTRIQLAHNTELYLIAPATANSIGKLAHGIADDVVTSFALAVECPVVVAPAMNMVMLMNKIVQENIQKIKKNGIIVIEPGKGHLACGDFGAGRLAEPNEIIRFLEKVLKNGKKKK